MTKAVCFNCGEFKYGAFVECDSCNKEPNTSDEFALSLAFTDWYTSSERLEEVRRSLQSGYKVVLDEDFMNRMLEDTKDTRLKIAQQKEGLN